MLSSLPSHLRAQSASETVWALGRVGRGADGRTASRKSATEPGVKAPTTTETPRLILRRPEAGDIDAMFARYASDPVVTRYLGWATHHAVDETQAFLALSDAEWERWPAGPYLMLTCRRRSPWRHRPGVRDPAPRVNRLRARSRCLGSRVRHRDPPGDRGDRVCRGCSAALCVVPSGSSSIEARPREV